LKKLGTFYSCLLIGSSLMNSHGVDNRSRQELLMALQDSTSKNRQLRMELERAKLERDRAVIDRKLLEMSTNTNMSAIPPNNDYNCNQIPIYKTSNPSHYSVDNITSRHHQRENLSQGNSWAPPKLEVPSVKFEQQIVQEQADLYQKKIEYRYKKETDDRQVGALCIKEIIPSDKIYEVCLRAFESFPNGKGKADDVENYIHNYTKYVVPVRRVLGARLRTLAEKGKLVALVDRKINKRPQEYRLKKRSLSSNITGRDSKKLNVANSERPRKRVFIFCKHCKEIFYLMPHSVAINSFKHKCNNVTVTRNLKGRAKSCTLFSHSGPCIRYATKKERLNVKNIRSRGKAVLDRMYRDMGALPITQQEHETEIPYSLSKQNETFERNN